MAPMFGYRSLFVEHLGVHEAGALFTQEKFPEDF
jgi:hypothetical protein